ncbi:Fe-S cluster assembly ATPase SufC [Deinococcus indicus]|jgi:Fe-S cluster assembly ATP-binding protein|uniref:Fe-S cluster assembly ATPase SufC n=2 Tax=Deinococcus TaxID=1298 RepID=A0A2D0A7J8_9DEIO|nr:MULTISPECIES: Fe-S cluster assembly ATPase SufC [Deinococcus]MBX8466019.1 Fe-S cluster assembly ATPase SufC [Deinococcus sp. RIT780]MCD0157615.1 Fe-S cluster assembly ATPase SufC [Deinococcus sp. 6GRE01]MCD0162184.1 Fe-S cluster assembly ATPase SufC [Deinococcus sp. 6YEL10]MCD0165828.1 Fe-S cluster assembly ATPase SufC [Deinococcus sp. 12RED42]MCD0169973.1 Fe-S cluster assembly ATPase SufC [Deinococcus sp. 23YEL01]
MTHQLEIRNLHATVGDTEILKGINLIVPRGELHAIMGPNGNGKSTLAKVIVGDPEYTVTQGEVLVDGQNILEMEPDERARLGVFLAFQYPVEIPGVTIANFLRLAMQARKAEGEEVSFTEFYGKLQSALKTLEWDESIVERYLNAGFSGGEKKRNEILQMLMLEPNYIIMDETDSGLDVDALKIVSKGVNSMRGPGLGGLIITHYQRLLDYIVPDKVHIILDGKVVQTGGPELAKKMDTEGYDWVKELATA